MSRERSLDEIVSLFHNKDSLAISLATGQPRSLLLKLSEKEDWEKLEIISGLLVFPYPILNHPKVFIKSGYYGPLERMLNEAKANIQYLPNHFRGFEAYAKDNPSRIVATTLSSPDEEGYCSFGAHGAAIYNSFIDASKDPKRLAIAEINPKMPRVYGLEEFGDNKIHINEIDAYFFSEQNLPELPSSEANDVEKAIAKNVLTLIESEATLQFGIGNIPNLIANELSKSQLGGFGIHSELISDGFLTLVESGKINNLNKGVFKESSIFTFAFGSQKLYDYLDERQNHNHRSCLCLPVSIVNHPYFIAQNPQFISINSGLMVDFNGQVCSEALGLRQYSGVGGQLSFVQGAAESLGGKSIICIKSSAVIDGKRVSNILPYLPLGSIVSTPRHYTQFIVTEYGIANLYTLGDEERGEELIKIAHPEFRDELQEQWKEIKNKYY